RPPRAGEGFRGKARWPASERGSTGEGDELMTNPMPNSILAASAIALAVTITSVAPTARAAVATDAPSPGQASAASLSGDDGEAPALGSRARLARLGAAPRDDGSDSGDGGGGQAGARRQAARHGHRHAAGCRCAGAAGIAGPYRPDARAARRRSRGPHHSDLRADTEGGDHPRRHERPPCADAPAARQA